MSEPPGTICYIVQQTVGAPLSLCVMDRDKEQYHVFPISLANASRLAAECSAAVNSALGGVSDKHAVQDIAKVLSGEWGRR
jgi:hypothetical protein